jgi:hypothetical protein
MQNKNIDMTILKKNIKSQFLLNLNLFYYIDCDNRVLFIYYNSKNFFLKLPPIFFKKIEALNLYES